MADSSSDEEDSISKIDFSVISTAIEEGGKMVQQILNCVHYGTAEVRDLMFNECDFIVECRVCRNLFRNIPNFVAHKRIYCTDVAEQTSYPSAGSHQDEIVVVQPEDPDVSPGSSSGSVSLTATSSTSSIRSASVTRPSSTVQPRVSMATRTVRKSNEARSSKSALAGVTMPSSVSPSMTSRVAPNNTSPLTPTTSSQMTSKMTSQVTSATSTMPRISSEGSALKQSTNTSTDVHYSSSDKVSQGHSKDDDGCKDENMSTLKLLLTGQFKGKSSDYSFYSRTVEKMERERKAKESSVITMTPIPTNPNAAYITVTQGGSQNATKSVQSVQDANPNMIESRPVERPVVGQSCDNIDKINDKKTEEDLVETEIPDKSNKRKSNRIRNITNEGTPNPSSEKQASATDLNETSGIEQNNRKHGDLRPVRSELGSHQNSELTELGLMGHCNLSQFKCLLCFSTYSCKKSLLQHMHVIHSGRKTVFPCSLCDKTFSYFWGLTRHLQNNHDMSKQTVDKMRSKLRALAYETAESDHESTNTATVKNVPAIKSQDFSGRSQTTSQESNKQTASVFQSSSLVNRVSRAGGIKLNKCDGCGKAFWKQSSYHEHTRQCKWLVPSAVVQTTEKSSTVSIATRNRSVSRDRKCDQLDNNVNDVETAMKKPAPVSKYTASVQHRPSTRSKVMEADNNAESSNLEPTVNGERMARARMRSKVITESKPSSGQDVSEVDKLDGLNDTGFEAMEEETSNSQEMEGSDETSRNGSDQSPNSNKSSGENKALDHKSPSSSPSKWSTASNSPNSPTKQWMVTRHLSRSLQKGTQYMRTRFFEKRRESQAKPDRSPQNKTGLASSASPSKRDDVKVALTFDGKLDGKTNKPQDETRTLSCGQLDVELTNKDGGSRHVAKETDNEQENSKSERSLDTAGSKDSSQPSEGSETSPDITRNSRESRKDGSSSRPSTRSVSIQGTEEGSKDRSRSREGTESTTSTRRDRKTSSTEVASRDSSRESLKDASSRPSTNTRGDRKTSSTEVASRDSSRESLKDASSRPSTNTRRDCKTSSAEVASRDNSRESRKDASSRPSTNTRRDCKTSSAEVASRDSSRESRKDASSRPSTNTRRDCKTSSAEVASRDRSRESRKDSSSRPSTNTRRDCKTSSAEVASRDSSRESMKDASTRPSTRSSQTSKESGGSRERSSSTCSSRRKSPVGDPKSRENCKDTSSSNSKTVPVEPSTESSCDRSSRISTRITAAQKTSGQNVERNVDKSLVEKSDSKSSDRNIKEGAENVDDKVNQLKTSTGRTVSRESVSGKLALGRHGAMDQKDPQVSQNKLLDDDKQDPTEGVTQRQSGRLATRKSAKLEETDSGKVCEESLNVGESLTSDQSLPMEISTKTANEIEKVDMSNRMTTRRSLPNTLEQKEVKETSVPTTRKTVEGTNITSKGIGVSQSKTERSTSPTKTPPSGIDRKQEEELLKRSTRTRNRILPEDSNVNVTEPLQPLAAKSDEVDGTIAQRSTRSGNRVKVKNSPEVKEKEDSHIEQSEVLASGMVISSGRPKDRSFLGLEVTPHVRKSSRVSHQFTPRIPQSLESETSNTDSAAKTTDNQPSSVEEPKTDVKLIEEIWVQKEPGQPSEEVWTNMIYVVNANDKSTVSKPSAQAPPASASSHTTRASEKMRSARSQMYVTDPKTTGISQESVQTKCLDLNRIGSLSDERDMKCLQCDLEFSCLSNLRRHVVRHLGWRRYKCKLCKFSSYNKSECNTHLIRSHGRKARNCAASTLIIDLNKEASKARSQKKINTIKSRTTGPLLRSRNKEMLPKRSKADVLMSTTEHADSEVVDTGLSELRKTTRIKPQKDPDSTEHLDLGTSTVPSSSRVKKAWKDDGIEAKSREGVSSKLEESPKDDADAHILVNSEEMRKTRKRRRTDSENTTSSKGEVSKSDVTPEDTKRAAQKRKVHEEDTCSKEEFEDVTLIKEKQDSVVIPAKRRHVKHSASSEGTTAGLQEEMSENLSDSWDIPSVSDFDNSDSEVVYSPPTAKVAPDLGTMMAALEEARAFKFVRHRGKGRRSIPLIKKTARSESSGSHTDGGTSVSREHGEADKMDKAQQQSDVLETSSLSTRNLDSEEPDNPVMDTNSCVSQKENTGLSTRSVVKESSSRTQESSSRMQESSSRTQEDSSNMQDNSTSPQKASCLQECSSSAQESGSSAVVLEMSSETNVTDANHSATTLDEVAESCDSKNDPATAVSVGAIEVEPELDIGCIETEIVSENAESLNS